VVTEQTREEAEQKRDEILRRMLKMPPKPYTPKPKRKAKNPVKKKPAR
jgi:hypothetical protein